MSSLCLLEVDKQMAVFDDIAKLLRDAGGLRGKDLRATEFISSGGQRSAGKESLRFTC